MITRDKLFTIRDSARNYVIEQEEAARKDPERAERAAEKTSRNFAESFKANSDPLAVSQQLKNLLEGLEEKKDPMDLLNQACQIIDTALHGYDSPYADSFGQRSRFLLSNYNREIALPFDNGYNKFEKILFIDIETYSSADLKLQGVYRYAAEADFDITLLAYAYDTGLVHLVDLASGERLPADLLSDLVDPKVLKVAHNASFERVCLSRYLNKKDRLDPDQWFCTEVYAEYLGLPGSLKAAGQALGVTDQKMEEGRSLINLFATPVKRKDGPFRYMPEDKPEEWRKFKDYCIRDVETDREIYEAMLNIQLFPYAEWLFWQVDQRINDLGIQLDLSMVNDALSLMSDYEKDLTDQINAIAPGINLRSEKQLKEYLASHQISTDSVDEKHISRIIRKLDSNSEVYRLLKLRQKLAKTATKKFEAFKACEVNDRALGTLTFYGANTGRWSGKLIQPQNLPKPVLQDVDRIRTLLKAREFEQLKADFDDIQDALITVLRTMLIPAPGKHFVVADYNAIEARVVAWLSGEQWVLDAFANGEDIYCKTASQMYGVPVEKNGLNSDLRAKGKIAVLACGYGGSVDAMKSAGAEDFMDEKAIEQTVKAWRKANPNTYSYWYKIQDAAIRALKTCSSVTVDSKIRFEARKNDSCTVLFCYLPSGRALIYQNARVTTNNWGKEDISYTSRKGTDTRIWGGKLVENITQAVARDCLAASLYRLDKAGLPVVFHVHDEIIVETEDPNALEKLCKIMAQPIKAYPGLALKAEGYVSPYYTKD